MTNSFATGIAGLVISFYTDMATGASIILVASLCFLLTFIISLVRR
jgi:ABC-type Mn2+/Zn2+ transport system permease subunit